MGLRATGQPDTTLASSPVVRRQRLGGSGTSLCGKAMRSRGVGGGTSSLAEGSQNVCPGVLAPGLASCLLPARSLLLLPDEKIHVAAILDILNVMAECL